MQFFSSKLACQLVLLLCGSCLGNHIAQISWMQVPFISITHYLTAAVLVFCLLQSFCLLQFSLSLRYRGCIIDVPRGNGHPMVTYFLYYDQLRVFTAKKRSFFDEKQELHLSVGM